MRYLFSIACGRLMNQHSDLNETKKLLGEDDLIKKVVLTDLFMTPSAKVADLILPAPSFFETENINLPWSDEDYALYNHKAIKPLFGTRFELDWLNDVAKILGIEKEFQEGRVSMEDWLRVSWEEFRKGRNDVPTFEVFKESGLAVLGNRNPKVTFSDVLNGERNFHTPSGRIEILWSQFIGKEHLPALPCYVPTKEGVEEAKEKSHLFQLIAFHSKRLTHSIHDQNRLLEELEKPSVWINTEDAKELGIENGETVEVYNGRGTSRLPAFVTGRIMKGVLAMQEGYWYSPDKNGVDTRGSINVLTFADKANPIGHSTPQHTNLASVRKVCIGN